MQSILSLSRISRASSRAQQSHLLRSKSGSLFFAEGPKALVVASNHQAANYCAPSTCRYFSTSLCSRGSPILDGQTKRKKNSLWSSGNHGNVQNCNLLPVLLFQQQVRYFESESEYHNVADETLEIIQDTVEEVMEDAGLEAEINFASGVLTMTFPEGTYVINKQTPNQQVWWSSPISGPRRYEYDETVEKWVFTREESITLGESLKEEFQELFGLQLDLDL